MNRFVGLALALALVGCGGGGGGSSVGRLTVTADFADPTREVPGYADTLRVTVTPPAGVSLPGSLTNPFLLTRASASRVLSGLVPNASPYAFDMEALTDGIVVGTVQRSVFVTAGMSQEIDVSAFLQSEIASVEVEGTTSATVGNNVQYTAHAKNSTGQTLFSGAGFAWTSTNPLVLIIDADTGFAIPRAPGTVTVRATLKGTTVSGTLQVDVALGGEIGVTIDPPAAVVLVSAQRQFIATVTGLANTSVTWSIDEPGGGTVTAGGLYTAPSNAGTYTVRATSQAQPSATATASVSVQPVGAWNVINLHPVGALESEARGVRDGKQIGTANSHAALWSGTAASWIDLHPAAATSSHGWRVSASQQVGVASFEGVAHASLWSGTAASWIDLHPPMATGDSIAYGVDGAQQAGVASIAGHDHAGLWSGSAASWVDLHPVGATDSIARATNGGQQVGYTFNGTYSAALWTGTAASWVSLQPEELGDPGSFALDVHAGQQVGYISIAAPGSPELHASLWAGSAASWVDLHPAATTTSVARSVHGGQQVGYTILSGKRRAALWSGTAASWVDLHVYLPSNFSESSAEAIWHNGGITYVVGSGFNLTTGRTEALMWVGN